MVRASLQRRDAEPVVIGAVRRAVGLMRSFVVYWRPGRQRALRRLYAPFVRPGDLVFDLGAHLGDRAAAFAALGADVVAVEPNPELVPWLRRLMAPRAGVTIVAQAVGSEEGSAPLALSDATPTLSTLAEAWRERIVRENPTFRRVRWDRTVEVPVTTLDALIERFGEPAFCKIDVEGHEAVVLEGLGRPLQAVSFEFVTGGVDVASACVGRLVELGAYEFNVIVGERRSFALPGWVDADEVQEWLEREAGEVSSGDVYARRRSK